MLSDTTAPLSRRPSDFEFGKLRKIELELWSFFMGISKEEGSAVLHPNHIHIHSADVPRRDSFCLRPGSSIASVAGLPGKQ